MRHKSRSWPPRPQQCERVFPKSLSHPRRHALRTSRREVPGKRECAKRNDLGRRGLLAALRPNPAASWSSNEGTVRLRWRGRWPTRLGQPKTPTKRPRMVRLVMVATTDTSAYLAKCRNRPCRKSSSVIAMWSSFRPKLWIHRVSGNVPTEFMRSASCHPPASRNRKEPGSVATRFGSPRTRRELTCCLGSQRSDPSLRTIGSSATFAERKNVRKRPADELSSPTPVGRSGIRIDRH